MGVLASDINIEIKADEQNQKTKGCILLRQWCVNTHTLQPRRYQATRWSKIDRNRKRSGIRIKIDRIVLRGITASSATNEKILLQSKHYGKATVINIDSKRINGENKYYYWWCHIYVQHRRKVYNICKNYGNLILSLPRPWWRQR